MQPSFRWKKIAIIVDLVLNYDLTIAEAGWKMQPSIERYSRIRYKRTVYITYIYIYIYIYTHNLYIYIYIYIPHAVMYIQDKCIVHFQSVIKTVAIVYVRKYWQGLVFLMALIQYVGHIDINTYFWEIKTLSNLQAIAINPLCAAVCMNCFEKCINLFANIKNDWKKKNYWKKLYNGQFDVGLI